MKQTFHFLHLIDFLLYLCSAKRKVDIIMDDYHAENLED